MTETIPYLEEVERRYRERMPVMGSSNDTTEGHAHAHALAELSVLREVVAAKTPQADRAELVARTAFAENWENLEHTVRVVAQLGPDATDWEKATAWLHDVVEDTPLTLEDLHDMGFPIPIVNAVGLVTNDLDSYAAYKMRLINSRRIVEGWHLALRTKLADARENLERCKASTGVPKWQRLATTRYQPMIDDLEALLAA